MRTESRVFWMPKDIGYEGDYEDAYALDETRGVAAVADGVSSAIFSRQWADILTRAVIAGPPDVSDESFWPWLADRREEWTQSINFDTLGFFQKRKLQQVGGAFSTLLWIEWAIGGDGEAAWKAVSAGDCGLFHLRDGQLLTSFPITTSEELAADPVSLCSANLGRDGSLEFRFAEGTVVGGDLIVLTTDALLGWALRQIEAGTPPNWDEFWNLDDEAFRDRIIGLRNDDAIRVDDTTLVLLRVLANAVESESLLDETPGDEMDRLLDPPPTTIHPRLPEELW